MSKKIKKFLYVEDGSIDTESLIAELENGHRADIKVIVYRQGSYIPQLVDLKSCRKGK